MRKSFTFIELLLATVLLSIGIVAILRSFSTVLTSMDYLSMRRQSVMFLSQEMSRLEQKSFQEKGLEGFQGREDIFFGGRPVVYQSQGQELSISEPLAQEPSGLETENSLNNETLLMNVTAAISWKEGRKDHQQSIACVFPASQKKE
jgi:Tfp pilus assembly protein PilV